MPVAVILGGDFWHCCSYPEEISHDRKQRVAIFFPPVMGWGGVGILCIEIKQSKSEELIVRAKRKPEQLNKKSMQAEQKEFQVEAGPAQFHMAHAILPHSCTLQRLFPCL